jgi:hypothetical protein
VEAGRKAAAKTAETARFPFEWLAPLFAPKAAASPVATAAGERGGGGSEPGVVGRTGSGCPRGCHGRGVCNPTLGECRCEAGWDGRACEQPQPRRCNERPHQKSASLCDGTCADDRGLCYCNGSHPDRPLPMQVSLRRASCGFLSASLQAALADALVRRRDGSASRCWASRRTCVSSTSTRAGSRCSGRPGGARRPWRCRRREASSALASTTAPPTALCIAPCAPSSSASTTAARAGSATWASAAATRASSTSTARSTWMQHCSSVHRKTCPSSSKVGARRLRAVRAAVEKGRRRSGC